MRFNPDIHHRRSIRLHNYDYAQKGAYFITICAQNRECLFGKIVDSCLELNEAGEMISRWYDELENKFAGIRCGAFVCMPNHVHFVVIVGADLRVRPDLKKFYGFYKKGEHAGSPLHIIVQWFKTMTTNEYIRGVKKQKWIPFLGKLWQRNYYEHIVRNEDEFNRICQYISKNPALWEIDRENPEAVKLAATIKKNFEELGV